MLYNKQKMLYRLVESAGLLMNGTVLLIPAKRYIEVRKKLIALIK